MANRQRPRARRNNKQSGNKGSTIAAAAYEGSSMTRPGAYTISALSAHGSDNFDISEDHSRDNDDEDAAAASAVIPSSSTSPNDETEMPTCWLPPP